MYICQVAKTESRLSREMVADGALALADAEGLEALTIRRLAQELGVTPMALYWHFKNKDELLSGVVDQLWGKVDTTRDLSRPLLEQFRALVESLVAVLREHRSLVPLLQIPRDHEPCAGFLEATETALVLGEPGVADPRQTLDDAAESIRRKRLFLESLPRNRYPRVVQAAEFLTYCENPDDHYTFGLDFFIGGVTALPPVPS